uniref:Uncharacterized protein n=1 Tax=Octopus bimaculoides TaxID=37653 RepID=A0A0L8HNW2_OCTBM
MSKHQASSPFSMWTCGLVILILVYTSVSNVDALYLPGYRLARRGPPANTRCLGFPCIYSQLSSKLGNIAVTRALMQKMRRCLANPSCVPNFSVSKK